MADIYMTQGNRLPSISATLMDDNGPVNLSAATAVYFVMSRNGVQKVSGLCTVISAAEGEVQYDWALADVDTPGQFIAQFEVRDNTPTTPKKQNYPSTGYMTVQINENPAT
jgi:hypothetical protein